MLFKKQKSILVIVLCFAISISLMLFASICDAEEWSSCTDDFDQLGRAARDAADAAEQAEYARQEFESKKEEKEELENCLNYPDVYDLMQDNCQSLRWDYESARNNYEAALSNLEGELDTVLSRFCSIEWSCDVQYYPRMRGNTKDSQKNRICRMLQSYKGKSSAKSFLTYAKSICLSKNVKNAFKSNEF